MESADHEILGDCNYLNPHGVLFERASDESSNEETSLMEFYDQSINLDQKDKPPSIDQMLSHATIVQVLRILLEHNLIDTSDLLRLCCVSTQFRCLASDASLWRIMARKHGIASKVLAELNESELIKYRYLNTFYFEPRLLPLEKLKSNSIKHLKNGTNECSGFWGWESPSLPLCCLGTSMMTSIFLEIWNITVCLTLEQVSDSGPNYPYYWSELTRTLSFAICPPSHCTAACCVAHSTILVGPTAIVAGLLLLKHNIQICLNFYSKENAPNRHVLREYKTQIKLFGEYIKRYGVFRVEDFVEQRLQQEGFRGVPHQLEMHD